MAIRFHIRLVSDTVLFLNNTLSVYVIMDSEDQKIALIAISNPITSGRISTIMKEKNWLSKKTSDGDKAVDIYVKYKPKIVFISINLSTINGHVTALEIREIDANARIIFITSKTRISKVEDIAYSAGAVGILTTPLTKSKVNEKWNSFFLEIPEAHGLPDLDVLYPEIAHNKQIEKIPPPIPPLPPLSQFPTIPNVQQEKKIKRRWFRIVLPLFIIISSILYFLLKLEYFELN